MPFSETFLEELSQRSDIVDVVSEYVNLNKRSGGNRFGLCPFHSEKTPSFSVNPDRQIYHCFGCGKGGGVINFIMGVENLSFPDAVRFLARRAGMEVPEDQQDPTAGKRTRMLQLNRDAARFFYARLIEPNGAPAQDYVRRRGIVKMVKPFGLGYAPDSWTALTDTMLGAGYTKPELIEAGLSRVGKKGGLYDYFRNRLMFPVIDVRGSIIGFSGRIIGDGEPKYLNSPDTLVYKKSQSVFALNLAKKSKSGYILLVEGNIDVVSLHQAGFDSAVASLGTSLTAEQARLLQRYTQEIIIAYDSDGAGKKAAQRAIGLLQPLEVRVRVLSVPDAKDPDEFIQTHGPAAFREIIERSEGQMEYRLDRLCDDLDMTSPEGRVEYLRQAAKLIAALPGSVEREVYGARAAEKAGVTAQAFANEVAGRRRRNTSAAKKQLDRTAAAPARNIQPKSRELRFDNIRSAAAEEGILALLFRFPEQLTTLNLTPEDFSSPALGHIFEILAGRIRAGQSLNPAVLGGLLAPDETELLAEIIQHDESSPQNTARAMQDYVQIIQDEAERRRQPSDETAPDALLARAERLKQKKGYGG